MTTSHVIPNSESTETSFCMRERKECILTYIVWWFSWGGEEGSAEGRTSVNNLDCEVLQLPVREGHGERGTR